MTFAKAFYFVYLFACGIGGALALLAAIHSSSRARLTNDDAGRWLETPIAVHTPVARCRISFAGTFAGSAGFTAGELHGPTVIIATAGGPR
jgi:hypothetical protein